MEITLSFDLFTTLLLLFMWIFIFLFILKNNYSRLLGILFLYISPLSPMLILSQFGFRFQIVIALQFIGLIIMLIKNLKNRMWQKGGRFIIYFFILVMLCSTIFPFFLFQIFVKDTVEILRLFSYSILPALNAILFLIVLNKISSNNNVFITKLAKFFLFYGVIIIIEAFFSMIFGVTELYSRSFGRNMQLATFIGGGPDSISRIMVISVLSSFYIFQIDKKRIKFFFFLFLAIIIIFFTFSRTGYILLIIALSLIFIKDLVYKKSALIIFLLMGIIIVFIANYIDLLRLISSKKGSELYSLNTWDQRIDLFNSAIEMITNNFHELFWGVGYRKYLGFVEAQGGAVVGGVSYFNRSFENKYFEFIIETGFLGLFFILYFLITCISTIIKNYFIKDNNLFLMNAILIIILIGSMVVNMDWILFYLFVLIIIKNYIQFDSKLNVKT